MNQTQLLDGRKVAANLLENLKDAIAQRHAKGLSTPKLATIQVGNNQASSLYIRKKMEACQSIGMLTQPLQLPKDTTQHTLLAHLEKLNQDPSVHGILVQLPLPTHLTKHTQTVLESLDPNKDVDGFHPVSIGRLAQKCPHLRPCTPYGIITLLKAYDIALQGKHAVVVGASNIVGRPMALELLLEGATVTVCHSKTEDLKKHVACADLLISATGKRGIIDSQWIAPGSVVVDVGIHHTEANRVVGDLDFETAKKRAARITPVPGGVGPMTIATLLQNTLTACKKVD